MSSNQSIVGFRSKETWTSCLQEYCLSGAELSNVLEKSIQLCTNPSIRRLLSSFQNDDRAARQYILPLSQQLEANGHIFEAAALLSLELLFFLEPIKEVSAFNDESAEALAQCLDMFLEKFSAFPLLTPIHCMANYLKGTFLLSRGEREEALRCLFEAREGLESLDPSSFPSATSTLNVIDGNLGVLFIRNREPIPAYYHSLEAEKRLEASSKFSKDRNVLLQVTRFKAHQAAALHLMGDKRKSFEISMQAISTYESVLTSDELSVEGFYSVALNNVALHHYKTGEYALAREFLLRAQTVTEEIRRFHPDRLEYELFLGRYNLSLVALKLADANDVGTFINSAERLYRELTSNEFSANKRQFAAPLANLIGETLENHIIDGADGWYEKVRAICLSDHALNTEKGGLLSSWADYIVKNIENESRVYQGILNILSAHFFSEQQAESNLESLRDWLHENSKGAESSDCIVFCLNLGLERGILVGHCSQAECFFDILSERNFEEMDSFEEIESPEIFFQRVGDLNSVLPPETTACILDALRFAANIYFCGDHVAISLPWELLSVDPAEYSPLGLQSVVPRISDPSFVLIKGSNSPYRNEGAERMACLFAPFDTLKPNLDFAEFEMEDIEILMRRIGIDRVRTYPSKDATFLSFGEALRLEPEIMYFSGHGNIVHGEDSLVLHYRSNSTEIVGFGHSALRVLCTEGQETTNLKMPSFVYLNSCISGRSRTTGGPIQNLPGLFLRFGSTAVLSMATPISDYVASEFSKTFFEEAQKSNVAIGDLVLNTRRKIHQNTDFKKFPELWREWARPILYGDRNFKFSS